MGQRNLIYVIFLIFYTSIKFNLNDDWLINQGVKAKANKQE